MSNILTDGQHHKAYCHQSRIDDYQSRLGDVRRCEHRIIQVAYEPPGLVQAYWRDISPIFNPITYRRARRALEET